MSKKIISLLLALTLVFTLGAALVSCTEDNNSDDGGAGNNNTNTNTDTKDTYTVTVKDADGNAVSGVELAMVKVTDSGEIPYPTTQETSADGKTSFEVKSATWKVKVESVPRGYVLPETNYDFTDKAVTITLASLPKYTVKVVDGDGNPVVGASVQMCVKGDSGTCVSFREPTDENGESVTLIAERVFQAQITELPDGYSEIADKAGDYYDFDGNADDGFTVTIEVVKN